MQILVLGMHRSGTSAVVRLLNMMGASLGPADRVKGANPENPKGFWENDDVVEIDNAVLAAQRCLWDRLGAFDAAKLSDERLATLKGRARDVVIRLDTSRPWAVKDPRMCLLLPFWRDLLEVPVCVVVHRDPLEVAMSLRTRNDMPLHAGLAMWELHMLEALRESAGWPRLLVQYERIIDDPVNQTEVLRERFEAAGVRGLNRPEEGEITAFIDPTLRREKASDEDRDAYLTPPQRCLADALADGSALEMADVPAISPLAKEVLRAYDETLRGWGRIDQLKDILREREEELSQIREALNGLQEGRPGDKAEAGGGKELAALRAEVARLHARLGGIEQALAVLTGVTPPTELTGGKSEED